MYDIFWQGWDGQSVAHEIATQAKTEFLWILHEAVDYTGFDLNFVPDRFQRNMLHAWPSHNNPKAYTTWLMPNPNGVIYDDNIVYHEEMLPGHAPPIGVGLEGTHWEIDPRIDYSDFDFDWIPSLWESKYDHVFCLKGKDRLGYTTLKAPNTASQTIYHPSNTVLRDHYDVIELKMHDNSRMTREGARAQRYMGDMEAALRSAIRKAKREWLWVISDCIDYDFQSFDFEWLPDGDQKHYVHCWPSNSQKKGETFLIHVPTYSDGREFEFCFDHKPVARMPWPVNHYACDSLAEAIRIHPPRALYTQYIHMDATDLGQGHPCLWEKRPVIALNEGGSCSLVPRDCVVDREIYEYPYLERIHTLGTSRTPDVIFISNGEQRASVNYSHLLSTVGLDANIKHVEGIDGRLNSYQEAARRSRTDWFIAVFAKCQVTPEFKEMLKTWSPDYWQEPKHYIFHNRNLNNELEYGHMAPIAYNRRLMLENPGGLDLTLAQKHTTVPITVSSTHLDIGSYREAWRTAFREVLKLLYYIDNTETPVIEAEHRLWVWEHKESFGGGWIRRGAKDAREYYERCGGDIAWLMMSLEWNWLDKYFKDLYVTMQPSQH